MSFIRHIHACNPVVEETFWALQIDGQVMGWLSPGFAEYLLEHFRIFSLQDDVVTINPELKSFDQLSEALARVAKGLADAGIIPPLMNESYPVTPAGRDAAVAVIDRVAAAYFGLRSFGQHLNGFVRDGDEISLWIGRRARDRLIFPGALDNMVAGGLPYGISLSGNLVKECREEAGMSESLALQARPVGALSYNRVSHRGFRPDVLYCYDIELPKEFVPLNTDGEVEEFLLLPINKVMQIVHDSDEFKLNCNLVIIDFAIRHGYIGPEHADYLALVNGLRQPSGLLSAIEVSK